MTKITLAEEKAMKKKLINDAIDSKTQNSLINLYKSELGDILTQCADMHKDSNYTTSESYAAESANYIINGATASLIEDLYDLQVALYSAKNYDLPYECRGAIEFAEEMLSNELNNFVEGIGISYTTTESLTKLLDETMLAFSGESTDL